MGIHWPWTFTSLLSRDGTYFYLAMEALDSKIIDIFGSFYAFLADFNV